MKLSVDIAKDEARLRALRTLGAAGLQVSAESLYGVGQEAVNYLKRQYRSGRATTPTKTRVRTGDLRKSYGTDLPTLRGRTVSMDFGVTRPENGSVLEYASIHEAKSPTTIKPKEGRQWLTIPLGAVQTRVGVARFMLRDVERDAWFVPQTGRHSWASGKPIAFAVPGHGIFGKVFAKATPLFRLVRQVTVPPRPAIRPTWQRYLPIASRAIRDDLVEAAR